jgi:hypothetical protein
MDRDQEGAMAKQHSSTKRPSGMQTVFGVLTTLALIFFLWTLCIISTASIPLYALAIGTSVQ